MDKIPEVSVVIPAYNTAPYIDEALSSVFAQTLRDFEVIVVNDGSPDTDELERALKPHRGRITYIKQENKGVSAARNTGILAAKAPLVALLDSDDAWDPEYLSIQVGILRQKPTAVVVYPNAVYFGGGPETGRVFMDLCPSEGEVTVESLLTQRCNVMSSVTARREIMVDVGLFDETLRSAEDFDLWLRIVLRGRRIVYHHRPLVRYRQRQGSFMSDMDSHMKQVLRVVDKTCSHPSITPAQIEILDRERRRYAAYRLFLKGKQSLLVGDWMSGVDAWSEANRVLDSRALALKIWCLRMFPGVTLKAYNAWRRLGSTVTK